ncbi:MAG: hypothetical protein NT062_13350 [Proteobacteria bacterium]|nr:hypothetical protein [Pseudomonadota bacterium]
MTHQSLASLVALSITFMGCTSTPDPAGGGIDVGICADGDNCTCPSNTSCAYTCEPGAFACHVQGTTTPVDVTCDGNAECHVECSASASCDVDCGGSAECHVTCPASGCTVTQCSGPGCIVACGFGGEATYANGSATCP